jgi:putative ribosome biogenesis GTPase RsgA
VRKPIDWDEFQERKMYIAPVAGIIKDTPGMRKFYLDPVNNH